MKESRRRINLILLATLVLNYCVSQSSVFPVLFGEQSNSNADIRFRHSDYNEVKKLVAAGGRANNVGLFPGHSILLSSTSSNYAPLVSVYDESQDMNLLWSKALQISSREVYQLRFSPDGTKLVIGIGDNPTTIGVYESLTGTQLYFRT